MVAFDQRSLNPSDLFSGRMNTNLWGGGVAPAAPAATPPETSAAPASVGAEPGAGGTRDSASPGRGLSDPMLAVHQDLQQRFQIVPADFQGPRLPNQVSQEEFDHICGEYFDISNGNSSLKIDTSQVSPDRADAFGPRVMNDLASILQTPNGRELIDQLASAKDSFGDPRTTTISASNNQHPLDEPADPSLEANLHNGAGADMKVNHWERNQPGIRSDVNLFRELVGALHGERGDMLHGAKEDAAELGVGAFATGPGSQMTENGYRQQRRLLSGLRTQRAGDDTDIMDPRNG